MDLRDLKTFLHLAESRHFAAARAMARQPVDAFAPDPTPGRGPRPAAVRCEIIRTVTPTEAGKSYAPCPTDFIAVPAASSRHRSAGPLPLSGELPTSSALSPPPYSHLAADPFDRFRAAHPLGGDQLSTGDAADAVEKGRHRRKPTWRLPVKPETLPGSVAFSMLENLAVVLIALAPSLPGAQPGDRRAPRLVDSALYHGRPGAGTSAHRACGFGGHKISNPIDSRHRRRARSDGARWSPWDAARRCCRKWCWRTVRSRYATG